MDDASLRQALRLFLASPDPSPAIVEGGVVFAEGGASRFARDEVVLDEIEAGGRGGAAMSACGIGAEETQRALLRFLATAPQPRHLPTSGGLWFQEGGREWFARDDLILDTVSGRTHQGEADGEDGAKT